MYYKKDHRVINFIFFISSLLIHHPIFASNSLDYWQLPIAEQGLKPLWSTATIFGLKPSLCGLCHISQYQNWRESLHSQAFKEGFAGQLDVFDEQTQTMCLNCHAPRSEQQSQWNDKGIESITSQHGIDCASCHLRKQWHYSNKSIANTPHGAVIKKNLFSESMFCAPCHQFNLGDVSVNGKFLENTYNEWRNSSYAKAGITCQNCHMPQKKHLFKGIHDAKMTAQGLAVTVLRTEKGIELVATNKGAGHALPTYITPKIILTTQAKKNLANKKQYIINRQMQWDLQTGWSEVSDTRLMPGKSVQLFLPLKENEKAIATVIVEPDADYHDRVYPKLLKLLAKELLPEETVLLKKAQVNSAQSRYTLYHFDCSVWTGKNNYCLLNK